MYCAIIPLFTKNYKMHTFKPNFPKAILINMKFRAIYHLQKRFDILCQIHVQTILQLIRKTAWDETVWVPPHKRQDPDNSCMISYCRRHVTHKSTLFGSSPMWAAWTMNMNWMRMCSRMGAQALVLETANKTSWCPHWLEGIYFYFRRCCHKK